MARGRSWPNANGPCRVRAQTHPAEFGRSHGGSSFTQTARLGCSTSMGRSSSARH